MALMRTQRTCKLKPRDWMVVSVLMNMGLLLLVLAGTVANNSPHGEPVQVRPSTVEEQRQHQEDSLRDLLDAMAEGR